MSDTEDNIRSFHHFEDGSVVETTHIPRDIMSDTTIDDLLAKARAIKHTNNGTIEMVIMKEGDLSSMTPLKSALYDLMLEVIGVDDRIIELSGNSRFDQQVTSQVNGANDLRAEQRNKLKELFDE